MRVLAVFVLAVMAFLGAFSLFTVYQTERAITLRLGKIQLGADELPIVKGPGLHMKMPFIDSVRYFDTRLQTMSIESSRILTEEKKDVIVDLFIKWRVKDFAVFFIRTGGDKFRAERLLREQAIDGLRAEFGLRTVKEVVSGERQEIMDRLRDDSNAGAASFGIEVMDARIKRIDFPTEVSEKIYDRMRTERERIAAEHRAQGRSRAEVIKAEADARVTILLAESQQKSKQIRGQGDADATRIYAEAYSADPEFYEFYRSLDAYKETFQGNNDILVLKPEGQFFDYFNSARRAN